MPTQRRRRSSVSLSTVKPYKRNGSLHEHLRRLILDGVIPNGASLSQVELAERTEAVVEMRKHAADVNAEVWARAHRRFHRALVPEAGREFARTLSTYFDRAERLRRMF